LLAGDDITPGRIGELRFDSNANLPARRDHISHPAGFTGRTKDLAVSIPTGGARRLHDRVLEAEVRFALTREPARPVIPEVIEVLKAGF
jgi:hypothetical protein